MIAGGRGTTWSEMARCPRWRLDSLRRSCRARLSPWKCRLDRATSREFSRCPTLARRPRAWALVARLRPLGGVVESQARKATDYPRPRRPWRHPTLSSWTVGGLIRRVGAVPGSFSRTHADGSRGRGRGPARARRDRHLGVSPSVLRGRCAGGCAALCVESDGWVSLGVLLHRAARRASTHAPHLVTYVADLVRAAGAQRWPGAAQRSVGCVADG